MRCGACNHEIERRSDEVKQETGVDDDWWHLVTPAEGQTFGTLVHHDTIPIQDPAHPA